MQFSLDTVRAVTRLLHDSELSEISLETTGEENAASRLTVRREAPVRARRRPLSAEAPRDAPANGSGENVAGEAAAPGSSEKSEAADATITVSATAVGVYRCAKPVLRAGDTVKLGQVLGIVESLKIPNEVMAPLAGIVDDVLAEEGQAVEYGQALLTITPSQ